MSLAANRRVRAPLRLAVLGCGYWGRTLLACLARNPDVRIDWCCDPDSASLDRATRLVPQARSVRSASAIPPGEIDAAFIATPASTHFDVAAELLVSGCDLMVEKPLALSHADARELGRLAVRGRRVLAVGHQYLFHPAFRTLQSLSGTARLGPSIAYRSIRSHLGMVKSDVDAIWDMAPHDISMMNVLADGPPREVQAVGFRPRETSQIDEAHIVLRYPGGVAGRLFVSWARAERQRRFSILGETAVATLDEAKSTSEVAVGGRGAHRAEGEIVRCSDEPSLDLECKAFVASLHSREEPLASWRHAAGVVRVLEAIEASVAAGGEPILLGAESTVGGYAFAVPEAAVAK